MTGFLTWIEHQPTPQDGLSNLRAWSPRFTIQIKYWYLNILWVPSDF